MDSKIQRPLKRSIFALDPKERDQAKSRKGQKIITALITLLIAASRDIERVQNDIDTEDFVSLKRLEKLLGTIEKAKLAVLIDRFDEVIDPWLKRNKVSKNTIDVFKANLKSVYLDVLEKVKTNPELSVINDFELNLKEILGTNLDGHPSRDMSDSLRFS
jgi:hypothetical protein